NSAGVNTSDVEVNLKIALARPERDGRLSQNDRNSLLAAMTDEVGTLVLRNNYLQTLALSLADRKGLAETGFLTRLMQSFEQRGLLDRAVEFLPDDVAIAERTRRGQPFTRPELAVLLAYAKLTLYDDLLVTSVPDDPYLSRELSQYFPHAVQDRFPDSVEHHRLRREVISTNLANAVINRGGPACVVRLIDETDAEDRKSTRLNSSHGSISYAVFCLKKKNAFLAYNAGRLAEGCRLFAGRMVEDDVTVGMSLTGAMKTARIAMCTILHLIRMGFLDWH